MNGVLSLLIVWLLLAPPVAILVGRIISRGNARHGKPAAVDNVIELGTARAGATAPPSPPGGPLL
jgi:hypothetical protein